MPRAGASHCPLQGQTDVWRLFLGTWAGCHQAGAAAEWATATPHLSLALGGEQLSLREAEHPARGACHPSAGATELDPRRASWRKGHQWPELEPEEPTEPWGPGRRAARATGQGPAGRAAARRVTAPPGGQ